MQNLPLVSIIIPVYNTENYLKECLNSIFNQTYKNIEIICVNDGSTDNSLKILKEFESKYNNITIINLEQNQGVSNARNEALSIVKGDYVCFVDSDDYIEKDFCKELLNGFTNEIDLVCGGHVKLNNLGHKISPWIPKINISSDIINDILQLTKHRNVSQKMFKTKIIKENNILFDKSLHYMEDALFLVTYIQFCKKACGIKKPLYVVRINMNSLCRNIEYQERREQEKIKAINKMNIIINKIKKSSNKINNPKVKFF